MKKVVWCAGWFCVFLAFAAAVFAQEKIKETSVSPDESGENAVYQTEAADDYPRRRVSKD